MNDCDTVQTAILVSFAQSKLENKSEDIKWGLSRQAKDGTSGLINKLCYGYIHDKKGQLALHPEEAKTVRQIFKWRSEGLSLGKIADKLYAKKDTIPYWKEKWNREAINKMLHNEEYIGKVLYQKTYVEDLFEGKQVKNDRDLGMYHYIEHHDPIISKNIFKMVRSYILQKNMIIDI